MRALLQRVDSASVTVSGEVTGRIQQGLLVFLGIEPADAEEDVNWLAGKIATQRLFGAWEMSVVEGGWEILLISQFTLHASTRKGTKPSWHRAARPEIAIPLYEAMAAKLTELLGKPIATGVFGAMMKVSLVNDGPVTLLIDSKSRE